MREILFRGKRKDNGEWVYGFYFQKQNPLSSDGLPITHCISDIPPFGYEVIPETVGQFTGLYDKNGKKIFEGDIVKQNRNGFDTLYVTIFTDKEVGSCGCCYPSFDGIGFVFESVKETRANIFDLYPLEVVGNIHDNKEILTGQ